MPADSETQYHADELVAPDWLNAAYMENVLRQYEKTEVLSVSDAKFTPGTVKGDHYASIMFRAAVSYTADGESKQKSLIVKVMPDASSSKTDLIGDSHLFETEVGMYREVMPKFTEIMRAAGNVIQFGAGCVYHTEAPRQVIIFEDLCALGYHVVRGRYGSLAEVKAVYKKLARWHALSYKINIEQPTFLNAYRYHFMTMPNLMESEPMTNGLNMFLQLLEQVPALRQYKAHFEPMRGNYLQKIFNSFEEFYRAPQPGVVYVLNHGDFHIKNLMYKTRDDNDEVDDCMLVDFQTCYVGAQVLDLMYSFYTLMDIEVRLHHRDECLEFYFNEFLSTLTSIGYEGTLPQYADFISSLGRHKDFELFLLHTFLPMMLGFKEGKLEASEIFASNEVRWSLYQRQDYIDELKIALPKYLEKGYY